VHQVEILDGGLFVYTTTHCSLLRLIVRSWLDVPTFTTRHLHARAPNGERRNCGRKSLV